MRVLGFVYGVLAYAFAMATVVYSIGFLGGLAPKSIDTGMAAPLVSGAALVDVLLLGLFALQHSIMARPQFKQWWTRIVPAPIERSTYVLLSALVLALLYWKWQPIAGVVWDVRGLPGATIVLGAIFWLGWAIVFISTFLISHFDLFGLAQVWSLWRGTELPPPNFRTPFLYQVVRHPLYVGFILAFWATPLMTTGHLLFSGLATAYIFIGMWLEERDLVAAFGETYIRYRERVSMIVPLPPRG
jgi:protein-S-isoprenylcysteine O-methyltransferase Ste14